MADTLRGSQCWNRWYWPWGACHLTQSIGQMKKNKSPFIELWTLWHKIASECYWSNTSPFILPDKTFPATSVHFVSPHLPYEERQIRLNLRCLSFQKRSKNVPTQICMLGTSGRERLQTIIILFSTGVHNYTWLQIGEKAHIQLIIWQRQTKEIVYFWALWINSLYVVVVSTSTSAYIGETVENILENSYYINTKRNSD